MWRHITTSSALAAHRCASGYGTTRTQRTGFNESYKNIVPYTPVEGRQSINQQQAEYILKNLNYPRQRKVNSSQVNTIIDKMLTGAWIDGHTISFAKCDGKFYLVNGQHRMMAIAKCGKRQVFSVIISNCKTPDDVHKIYCTHDTGVRARSKVEVLASFGFSERYGLSKSVASKLYESSLLVALCIVCRSRK